MKTIKLLSLGLILSLALISCKNEETSENTAEMVADSIFTATQSSVASNLTGLSTAVSEKITELEATLAATLDETAKPAIQAELAKFKQYQEDLTAMGAKVAEATADTWAATKEEAEAIHYDVKSAIMQVKVSPEKAAQIAN